MSGLPPTDGDGDGRIEPLLAALEEMAGGDLDRRVPISAAHDQIDAIAHGVNVLVGELQYTAADLSRAKDAAEAANRAKTTFLRNVSHEIRTPLSAIVNLTHLLLLPEAERDPDRRAALVGSLRANGLLLLGLVDDLLDLSAIEAGKLAIERRPLDPRQAIAEVLQSLGPEAQGKGLTLSTELAGAPPSGVLADGKRLRQILTNVIGNAIKLTPRGGIRVRLAPAPGAPLVHLDVIAPGIGLSPERAPALFEPFTQADARIAERFGTSGLGLALARRLARLMGGELALLPGGATRGTAFRLSLPAAELPTRAPELLPPKRLLAGARLLLVEDHDELRDSMRELLQLFQAQVIAVDGGEAALDVATEGGFDVLLMDVRMPGIGGLEATRRLRARGVTTPIVALTADAVVEHREECLAAGCSAYLAKPVELDELVALIEHLCSRSQDQRR